MVKPPQTAAKAAIVAFEGVTVTRVQHHMGNQNYDGTITFLAIASGLEFKYIHQFYGVQNVQAAIDLGAQALKRDLDQLSAATMNVQYAQ